MNAIALPPGWQPGDLCGNCNRPILHHRADRFTCPATDCIPDHEHTETCWTFLAYRPDPLTESRRRLEATMAPGRVA